MTESRGKVLGRGLLEVAVILVGVLLALAADRWMTGLDDRAQETALLEQLVENLKADSAQIASGIEVALQRRQLAAQVVAGGGHRTDSDLIEYLNSVERLAWWLPLEYARETWDDLLATGRLTLIRDPGVRRAMSTYYNRIEWLGQMERDWDRQLQDHDKVARPLLNPLVRMTVLGNLPEGIDAPPVTVQDLLEMEGAVAQDRTISSSFGQVSLVYTAQRFFYELLLTECGELLALVRGAL